MIFTQYLYMETDFHEVTAKSIQYVPFYSSQNKNVILINNILIRFIITSTEVGAVHHSYLQYLIQKSIQVKNGDPLVLSIFLLLIVN